LRWQRLQTVYEYYVALHAVSESSVLTANGK
jgi:hypothetical protein